MKAPFAIGVAVAAFGLGIAADRLFFRSAPDNAARDASYQFTISGTDPLIEGQPAAGTPADGGKDAAAAAGGSGRRSYKGGIDSLLALVDPSSWGQDGDDIKDALRGASAADVVRLLEKLEAVDESDPRARTVRRAVFERYAEVDPKSALASVMETGDNELQRHVVHHAFESLARGDITAAIAAYEELDERDEFRHTAIRSMARGVDPEEVPRLAEFVKEMPDGRHFGEMFSRWAHHDPKTATAFVLALDNEELKQHWIGAASYGWGQRDPSAALAWIETIDSDGDRARAAEGIMHSLVRTDPVAASALVESLRTGDRQRHFAGEIARQWAQRDLEAAREWAEALPPALGDNAIRGILREWARSDPASTAAYLDKLPPSESTNEAMYEIARAWGKTDIEAAAAWAVSTENAGGRAHALNSIADQWARKDPAAAAEFASSLTNARDRQEILDNISHNWAGKDLEAAIGWVQNLDAADRAHAARGIMHRVAEGDPNRAVDLLGEFTADMTVENLNGSKFHEVAATIAARWSSHSPQEAAAWAGSLPGGSNMQRAVVERIADHWAGSDSMAASEWIVQLPEGKVRDAATGQLVENIAESDPASAFQWALSASDNGQRHRLMREVLKHWKEIDPDEARATIAAAPLDPEQRKKLSGVLGE